jgi:hypothetical protein
VAIITRIWWFGVPKAIEAVWPPGRDNELTKLLGWPGYRVYLRQKVERAIQTR